MRVEHPLFGHGDVIEERVTESGRQTLLIQFDASDTTHLLLAQSVTPSKTKGVKAETKKKPRSRRVTEPISDELIVPALDESLTDDILVAESEETRPLEA